MDEASGRIRQLAGAGLHTCAFFEAAGETVSRAVAVGGTPPFWNTIGYPAVPLILVRYRAPVDTKKLVPRPPASA